MSLVTECRLCGLLKKHEENQVRFNSYGVCEPCAIKCKHGSVLGNQSPGIGLWSLTGGAIPNKDICGICGTEMIITFMRANEIDNSYIPIIAPKAQFDAVMKQAIEEQDQNK